MIAVVLFALLIIPSYAAALRDTFQQCPCIRPKGSNRCVAYNSEHQAATIEEAVRFFKNPINADPRKAKGIPKDIGNELIKSVNENQDNNCTDERCRIRECYESALQQVAEQIGYTWTKERLLRNVKTLLRVVAYLGITQERLKAACVDVLRRLGARSPTAASGQEVAESMLNNSAIRRSSAVKSQLRQRRAITSEKQGDSTVLWKSCNYQKGDPLPDQDRNYVGLCNLCWAIRQLPNHIFPRYINEMHCDSKDSDCFRGQASCRPKYSTVKVLDTNKNAKFSHPFQVACDCQVMIGSPLHQSLKPQFL